MNELQEQTPKKKDMASVAQKKAQITKTESTTNKIDGTVAHIPSTLENDIDEIYQRVVSAGNKEVKQLFVEYSYIYGMRKGKIKTKLYNIIVKRQKTLKKKLKKEGVESFTDAEIIAYNMMTDNKLMRKFYNRIGVTGASLLLVGMILL